MKTRRNFVKGLFGFVGCCLATVKVKATSRPRINKDYEDGMKAAIRAGKGPAPTLGWKCYVQSLRHPRQHFQTGRIRVINYKDKTIDIMILDEYPINDPRSTFLTEENRFRERSIGRYSPSERDFTKRIET